MLRLEVSNARKRTNRSVAAAVKSLEEALAGLRPREERVEPVAGHAHGAEHVAVEEDAQGAAAAEDEVDVVGVKVQAKPRARARGRALVADRPAASIAFSTIRSEKTASRAWCSAEL